MDERIKRLMLWLHGKRAYPIKIEYFPTNRCNLCCIFCHKRIEPPGYQVPEIPITRMLELVEESAKLGVQQWHIIGGGEPLMRLDDTLMLMEAIKSHGIYGYLNTNGTNFNTEIINQTVYMGWDYIKFSLYGHKASIHDNLTQIPGAFKRITAAIKQFAGLKRHLGKNKPVLEVGPVLVKDNYPFLSRMAKHAHRLGADVFKPQSLTVYDDKGRRLQIEDDDIELLVKEASKAYQFCQKKGIQNNLDHIIEEANRQQMQNVSQSRNKAHSNEKEQAISFLVMPCYEPWLHLTIQVNGQTMICGFQENNFGGSVMNNSLEEIWFSAPFQSVRSSFLAGNMPSYCQKCVNVVMDSNQRLGEMLRKYAGGEKDSDK